MTAKRVRQGSSKTSLGCLALVDSLALGGISVVPYRHDDSSICIYLQVMSTGCNKIPALVLPFYVASSLSRITGRNEFASTQQEIRPRVSLRTVLENVRGCMNLLVTGRPLSKHILQGLVNEIN